jgi:rhamnosyltransferase
MRTLAVFAHFDPDGLVAPHVDRYLSALSGAVDRTVVVSTADPGPAERDQLARHGELVLRENVGYDFMSWKTGLDHVGDWGAFDRVVIGNDSVVGPLRPMAQILGERAPRDVDFWGMTASRELEPHVQSWFMVFERPVIASGLLHGFWRAMVPVSDRYVVIRRYEIGLSRLLRTGGLRMGSYLRPTPPQLLRAQARYRHAISARPDLARAVRRAGPPGRLQRWEERLRRPAWNPSYVFWDGALNGSLPFVKIEILRDDPYRMGPQRILGALERARPQDFAGVREYLERSKDRVRALRGIGGRA